MSNQHNNLTLSADEKIALLSKALLREKSARKQLEAKIAVLNNTKFEATKELLESYETARIRQIQLEFLSFLNREKVEDKNIIELIRFFIENVLQLLGQHTSLFYQLHKKRITRAFHTQKNQTTWQELALNTHQESTLMGLVPGESSLWARVEMSDDVKSAISFFTEPLLLSLRIAQQKDVETIILINIEHYCYSDDFKHILTIAANQLTDIVQKKSSDTMLMSNYSKLKKTVTLLKKTQQQLVHNEKMVSLGQLAAGIAHEINNPLSYLSSNLETLQDYIGQYDEIIEQCQAQTPQLEINHEELAYLKEDSADLLSACLNGINRVSEIVINLKQFSKKGNDEFTDINLIEVITDSLAIVSNKIKYNYTLTTHHEFNHLPIEGNFGQLQQVFVNLFINAIDAMPDSGTLTILTHISDEQIIIKVKDNGMGMASETVNRIFEPFYTTKGEDKGTGLGLSVSYAIITKHNATIQVDSKLHEGTEFTLTFPQAK